MSGVTEQLLLNSPYAIRVLAANVKSWQLDRMRRGGNWNSYRSQNRFERYFEMSWGEIEEEQSRRLQALVAIARRYAPFYRSQGDRLPAIVSTDDLRAFPTLSKLQALRAGQRLLHETLKEKYHYTGHTSGTTGTPFTFKMTLDALRTRFAMRDNFYRFHGCDAKERSLRLGGRLFMGVSNRKPPFWLVDRVTNQLMFSLYHMSDETMGIFLEPLTRYAPVFVTGYPSAIYTLAHFCRRQGVGYRPKAVFTDSETVLDYQREEIEAAWGCPIHDYYGMEAGWIAGQCKLGRYHISPLTSVVEILDEAGDPAPPGQLGEIVVTDLTNPLMPLIRYRTGDAGGWSVEPCECGWHTPTLDRVVGRVDDIVVLADGRKIGRLDHIFKTSSHIRECQIIQETQSQFTFLLVPDEGYTPEVGKAVLSEAYARLGRSVTITLEIVEAIPRTSMGKFRAVISKVNPGPSDAAKP